MIIMYGNGKTEFGPGIDIKLTADELADAIMKYVELHDVEIKGARTARVMVNFAKKYLFTLTHLVRFFLVIINIQVEASNAL